MAPNDSRTDKYIMVATCVVMYRNPDGKLKALIVKRGDEETEGPGLWTVPGGKMNRGDWGKPNTTGSHTTWRNVLRRAVRREVLEETGIEIDEFFQLPNRDLVFVRKDGTPTFVSVFYVFCRNKPRVQLGSESTDYRWVGSDELHGYRFISNVKEDIEIALEMDAR